MANYYLWGWVEAVEEIKFIRGIQNEDMREYHFQNYFTQWNDQKELAEKKIISLNKLLSTIEDRQKVKSKKFEHIVDKDATYTKTRQFL